MNDCNRCTCAANGKGAACTRRACRPREKRGTFECNINILAYNI